MLTLYTDRPRQLEWIALIGILLLAAALRLGSPGIVEFKQDEANLSVLALNMVHGREFPLLGIDSSVGIRNTPMSVYLIAVPYLFSSDPTAATSYVGLLNVIAVGLVYALARRYYGPLAAPIAALLYAVNPWAVIYSRKIWAQDMLPPFILLTVGTGLLGFLEGKRWAQLLHLPLLAITLQIHYGTFVLLPITIYLSIVGRKKLSRWVWGSLVLVVLVVLPYAIGAARAGLFNTDTLRKLTAPSDKPRTLELTGDGISFTIRAIIGTEIESAAGTAARDYLAEIPNVGGFFALIAAAVVASMLWLLIRSLRWRDSRSAVDIALLIWLIAVPLAFSVTWTAVYLHYMIPVLPVAFMVIGAAAADLWRFLKMRPAARRLVFAVGGVMLTALIVLQIWLQVTLLHFVNTRVTPEGFATPLGYLTPIRDAMLAQKPERILAELDGQYVGYHEETSVFNALLYDVPLVRFGDDKTDVYPAQPTLYLTRRCTATTTNFKVRPGDPTCYAISTRTPADLDLSAYRTTNPGKLRFANGAQIVAYQWQPDTACMRLIWTISRGPLQEDFAFAAHFINAQGQTLAGGDDLSWRGRYWRSGDTVIKRLCAGNAEQKKEIVGVRIGLYLQVETPAGKQFYNQDLYAPDGSIAGDKVEIKFLE